MKAQVWCEERGPVVDSLVKVEVWLRSAKTSRQRNQRWSRVIEAAHAASQSGVLMMPFADVPRVGYDLGSMQEIFIFTAADGELVVVSEKGVEALTLV